MADSTAFPTLDASETPVGFTHSAFTAFDALDASETPVGFTNGLGAASTAFPTLYDIEQPGRFRDVEG